MNSSLDKKEEHRLKSVPPKATEASWLELKYDTGDCGNYEWNEKQRVHP